MNEELADTFARCYGMSFVGLRYFNVYGPRQDPNGPYAAVVPRFFATCAAGQPPTIFGDGEQARDFTFVADVVRANLLAAAAPLEGAHAVNVGAGGATTVNQLARAIIALSGAALTPQYQAPRAGDVRFSKADTSRAQSLFGFAAEIDLDEGLRRTHAAS
jgi:nucleoside-diphosphate-sugar epimerase